MHNLTVAFRILLSRQRDGRLLALLHFFLSFDALIFADLVKDLLERCHAHIVALDVVLLGCGRVQLLEDLREVGSVLVSKLDDVKITLVHITKLPITVALRFVAVLRDQFLECLHRLVLVMTINLEHDTSAVAFLEEQRCATRLQLASAHDSDTVSKSIRLIHVVSRKNDDAVFG